MEGKNKRITRLRREIGLIRLEQKKEAVVNKKFKMFPYPGNEIYQKDINDKQKEIKEIINN